MLLCPELPEHMLMTEFDTPGIGQTVTCTSTEYCLGGRATLQVAAAVRAGWVVGSKTGTSSRGHTHLSSFRLRRFCAESPDNPDNGGRYPRTTAIIGIRE